MVIAALIPRAEFRNFREKSRSFSCPPRSRNHPDNSRRFHQRPIPHSRLLRTPAFQKLPAEANRRRRYRNKNPRSPVAA